MNACEVDSVTIRSTTAFSLTNPSALMFQVAKVLNTEDVETDLVPAMEVFLRDMEDVSTTGIAC